MAENAGRRAREPLPVSLRDKSAGQGVPHLTEGQVAGVQAQLSRSKRTALRSGRRWLPREAAADPAGAKPVLCPAARTAGNTRGSTAPDRGSGGRRPGSAVAEQANRFAIREEMAPAGSRRRSRRSQACFVPCRANSREHARQDAQLRHGLPWPTRTMHQIHEGPRRRREGRRRGPLRRASTGGARRGTRRLGAAGPGRRR